MLFAGLVAAAEPTAEQLNARAQDFIRSGKIDAGIAAFRQLADVYPDDSRAPAALLSVGDLESKQGNRNKALDTYQRVAVSYPGSREAPTAILRAGYTLTALGAVDDAISKISELVDRYPASIDAADGQLRIGYLSIKKRRLATSLNDKTRWITAARDAFGKVLKDYSEQRETAAVAAVQYSGVLFEMATSKLAPWDIVEPQLESVLHDFPDAPVIVKARVLLMQAEARQTSGDLKSALEKAAEVTREYSDCRTEAAWAQLLLGMIYRDSGDLNAAIAAFNKVFANYSDTDNFAGNNVRAAALLAVGQCMHAKGDKQGARAAFDKIISTWPTSSEALDADVAAKALLILN